MNTIKKYFEGPMNGFYRMRTKRELVLFIGKELAREVQDEEDVVETVTNMMTNGKLFRRALQKRGIDPNLAFFNIFIKNIHRDRQNKAILSYYADERGSIKIIFPLDVAPKSNWNPWPAMIDFIGSKIEILPNHVPAEEERLLRQAVKRIWYLILMLDEVWPQKTIDLFADLFEQMAVVYESI